MKNLRTYEEFNYKEKITDLTDSVSSFLTGTISKKAIRIENERQLKMRNIIKLIELDGYNLKDMSGIITDGGDVWVYKIFDLFNYGNEKELMKTEIDPFGEENWGDNDNIELSVCLSPHYYYLKNNLFNVTISIEPMSAIVCNRLNNVFKNIDEVIDKKITINIQDNDDDVMIKNNIINSIKNLIKSIKELIILQ